RRRSPGGEAGPPRRRAARRPRPHRRPGRHRPPPTGDLRPPGSRPVVVVSEDPRRAGAGPAGSGFRMQRVRVPLRVPLGGLEVREAVLVEGPFGWGEISPLPGYPCDLRRCEEAAREAAFAGWPVAVRAEV